MDDHKSDIERSIEADEQVREQLAPNNMPPQHVGIEPIIRTSEEKAAHAPDNEEGSEGGATEAIEAERDPLAEQNAQLQDQLLRARADFDNYRKRMARDNERMRKTAAENLVRDLLPVIDNLELATQHRGDATGGIEEGVEMVLKQFYDVLQRHGVEAISANGEPFNPEIHDAVMQREDDSVEPHTVIEEFQKGFRMGGIVLRASKVIVSSASEMPSANGDD